MRAGGAIRMNLPRMHQLGEYRRGRPEDFGDAEGGGSQRQDELADQEWHAEQEGGAPPGEPKTDQAQDGAEERRGQLRNARLGERGRNVPRGGGRRRHGRARSRMRATWTAAPGAVVHLVAIVQICRTR